MNLPEDAESVAVSCALVVLGATGDLAQRKLYPALAALASRGQLPRRLVVVADEYKEEHLNLLLRSPSWQP